MSTMMGNRLQDVRIVGQNLTAAMADACISASLSLSRNQVTQMTLTFADNMSADMWRYGVITPGTNLDYGAWQLAIDDVDFGPGPVGPTVTVKALSRYVAAHKKLRGFFSWGVVDVSEWMRHMGGYVGYALMIQPGLGTQDVVRQAGMGDGPGPNNWDVMSEVARTAGAWLFEVQDTLYFGTPEWFRDNAVRKVDLYFNSWFDYSDSLAGPPQYHGSGTGEAETLQFGLIAADSDSIITGEIISLTGAATGDMAGTWIAESVAYPMTIAGPVTVSCRRVGTPPSGVSVLNSDSTAILGLGEVNWAAGNFTAAQFNTNIQWPVFYKPGTVYDIIMSVFQSSRDAASGAVGIASVDAFVRKYTGVPLDYDGAYGAQCVDLTAFYFKEVVGVTPAGGNGKDIYFNQNAGVTKIPAGQAGRPGDVACWGASLGGGYGHVAVVLADQGGSLLTFSQNPGAPHQQVISKAGLIGYLRPNRAL